MRRGFTLIELIVALGIVAVMAAVGLGVLGGVQRKSNDNIAIGIVAQLGSNMSHYAAFNAGAYPANMSAATWAQMIAALGSYAELPSATPSVLQNFTGYVDTTGSTFQFVFTAKNGTGAWYCHDPNGMAQLSGTPSGGGPWSGCP